MTTTGRVVDEIMEIGNKISEIDKMEAYCSKNKIFFVRIETLTHKGMKIGPSPQSFSVYTYSEASAKVVVGSSISMACTSDFTKKGLKNMVENAIKSAKKSSPDTNFIDFAQRKRKKGVELAIDRDILNESPEEKMTDILESALSICEKDMELAGSIMSVKSEYSVANTNGIEVTDVIDTSCSSQMTAEMTEGNEVISSGMGWEASRLLSKISGEKSAVDAISIARIKPRRKKVPPGEYEVIFGPYAVADIFDNMISSQFTLGGIYNGTSWLPKKKVKLMSGKKGLGPRFGAKIAHEKITIYDNPSLKYAFGSRAYDDEGIPSSKTSLIENGKLTGVLTESYYAYLYGHQLTGNGFKISYIPGRCASAQTSGNPTNLVMKTGDMHLEEMISEVRKDAIYIPRTWYTYPMRYGGGEFSSSNRSTSFIVKKGELIPIAPNAFKMIGDIELLLRKVKGIGKDVETATTWASPTSSIVPHIWTSGVRIEKVL